MMDDARRLDGNAIAGLLAKIFGREMTSAIISCAECGATGPVGAVLVYQHGMGTIVRCAACESVLFRVAEIRGQSWLDLRGIAILRYTSEGAISAERI